ncbi:MAG: O-antigen/teichoic acid export membrane protein [Alphaproteobacteria bacterium]
MIMRFLKHLAEWKPYLWAVGTGHMFIAAQALTQLLLVPIYLATIGKTTFGIIVLITSFWGICHIGVNAMQSIFIRRMALSAGREDVVTLNLYFAATRVFLLVCYTLAASIMVALAYVYHAQHASEIDGLFSPGVVIAFAGLTLVANAFLSAEYYFLSAIRKQGHGHLFYIFGIAVFFLLVLPWLFFGGGIEGVIIAQFLSTAIAAMAAGATRRAQPKDPSECISWRDTLGAAREFAGQQGQSYLRYGLVVALLQGDILLVGILGGPVAAAEFTIIWKIAEVIILALSRISDSLQPEILQLEARGEMVAIRRIHARGLPIIIATAGLAGIAYGLTGPYIVALWIGAQTIAFPSHAFWAGGGAIFWLSIARFSAVFPHALARLDGLFRIAVCELASRVLVVIFLFSSFGYTANLVAVSTVHFLGIAWGYIIFARKNMTPAV